MRFFACFIPLGGRRLLRPICWLPTIGELVNWRMGECTHQFTTSPILQLICHLYQVPHLVDHAPHGRRVLQHDRVADPAQAEPADHRPLVALEPDRAFDERHLHGAALAVCSLVRHPGRSATALRSMRRRPHTICPMDRERSGERYALASSSISLPRSVPSVTGSLSYDNPSNVARTTLCGFADPRDFVRMFITPADSTTARTAPPAMMPVPSGAGFNSTRPDPNAPVIGCGMVLPCSGTRIRLFFAASIPFLIADGTSFALPTPMRTTPSPSPTPTSALKLRFLPPFTTFVTRLMDTTVSLMSSCDGSIRSRVRVRI